MRGSCVGVVLACWFGIVSPASARPKSFALNWVRDDGAETCITSRTLARTIESMFGPVFTTPGDAELSLEGRVWPEMQGARWRARISVIDRNGARLGVRELSSAAESCRGFDAAIVLVLAMSIDPEAGLSSLPSELLESVPAAGDPGAELLTELQAHPPPLAAEPATTTATVAPPRSPQLRAAPEAAPAAPRDALLELEAGVAAGIALLPNLSSGPAMGAAVRVWPRWSLALRGVFWLANDAPLAEPNPRALAISFSMVLASVTACGTALRSSRWSWDGCAGLAAGVRWSDAGALRYPADVTSVDTGPAASTQLRVRLLEALELRLSIAAYVALRRQGYTYREYGELERALFKPGRVQGWGWIGAAFLL